jgi:alpha-2-macroglobulin-like protein
VPQEGTISYYEVRGREIVLYWRGLDVGQRVEVSLDLIARVPGYYRGPASRAYLYYGAETKCWTAPMSIGIVAK